MTWELDVSLGLEKPEDVFDRGCYGKTDVVKTWYRYLVLKVIQVVTLPSALPDWHRKQNWCSYHRAQTHGTTQEDIDEQKIISSLPKHEQFDATLKALYPAKSLPREPFFGTDRNPPPPVRHSDDWMDQAEILALCNALGASDVSRPSYTSVAQPKASPYVVRLGKVVPTVRVLR